LRVHAGDAIPRRFPSYPRIHHGGIRQHQYQQIPLHALLTTLDKQGGLVGKSPLVSIRLCPQRCAAAMPFPFNSFVPFVPFTPLTARRVAPSHPITPRTTQPLCEALSRPAEPASYRVGHVLCEELYVCGIDATRTLFLIDGGFMMKTRTKILLVSALTAACAGGVYAGGAGTGGAAGGDTGNGNGPAQPGGNVNQPRTNQGTGGYGNPGATGSGMGTGNDQGTSRNMNPGSNNPSDNSESNPPSKPGYQHN
jgi:hypothetical protein